MSDRKKYYPCDACYAKASSQANGSEEMGQLIYDFLHFEAKACASTDNN